MLHVLLLLLLLFYSYEDDDPVVLTADNIRPRARSRMQWDQLTTGQLVMVNYNPDHPRQRGYWYDAEITRKVSGQG